MAAESEVLTSLFTVVVPVHKAVNNFNEMTRWLDEIVENSIPATLVVVADSCDDKTKTHLLNLKDMYNFELIFTEVNSPGQARNLGMKCVTTEWVVFWDSDDVGCPLNVLSAINSASKNCQAIIGTYEKVDRDTLAITWRSQQDMRLTEIGVDPGLWRVIFRFKRVADHYFPLTKMGEDQFFLASVNLTEAEVLMSDLLFYRYFIGNADQLTKNRLAILTLAKTVHEFSHLLKRGKFKFNDYVYVIYCRLIITGLKNRAVKPTKILLDLRLFSLVGIYKLMKGVCKVVIMMAKSDSLSKSPETTIIMTGGLGNQLFQLAAAMHSCRGIVNLEVDILKPRKTEGKLDLDAFELPSRVRIKTNSLNTPLIVTKTAGFLLRSGIHPSRLEKIKIVSRALKTIGAWIVCSHLHSRVNICVGQGAGYTEIENNNDSIMIGYFQSFRYFKDPVIQNDFMAIRPIIIGAKVEKLIDEALFTKPIFVHFRLTDYTTETRFGIPDDNYYRSALDSLVNSPTEPIWVFSDDIELARSRFPDGYSKQALFIETKECSPAEVLHLMRYGKHYVIANSSFSWWAATLRFERGARVIAPQPWFIGQTEPKDLIFPEWEREEIISHD